MMTFEEIGRRLGISTSAAHRAYESGMIKVKNHPLYKEIIEGVALENFYNHELEEHIRTIEAREKDDGWWVADDDSYDINDTELEYENDN